VNVEARRSHITSKERPMDDQIITSSPDEQDSPVLDSEHEYEQVFAIIDPNV
jgi:hypothetical protein